MNLAFLNHFDHFDSQQQRAVHSAPHSFDVPPASSSPNTVAALTRSVASSPRIKIIPSERSEHELRLEDAEAAAEYREHTMYQRIMQRRSNVQEDSSNNIPLIPGPNTLWNEALLRRMRDGTPRIQTFSQATGSTTYFLPTSSSPHLHGTSTPQISDEEQEAEEGMFELDI